MQLQTLKNLQSLADDDNAISPMGTPTGAAEDSISDQVKDIKLKEIVRALSSTFEPALPTGGPNNRNIPSSLS